MTWNLFGQYLDVALACVLIGRLSKLDLYSKYIPFLLFVVLDSIESLAYIFDDFLWNHGLKALDYRVVWASFHVLLWSATIWMVYALLSGILKQLPGILRFSFRLLNIVFGLAAVIALLTVRPEYISSATAIDPDWIVRITSLAIVLDRAFAFAELLAILSILSFVLFFPIRVRRNLALFSTGLSIYLCIKIGWRLAGAYLPGVLGTAGVDPLPYVMALCVVFWICTLSPAGEETRATLGRAWQSMPSQHLVRQLEAMNSALLRSREQA